MALTPNLLHLLFLGLLCNFYLCCASRLLLDTKEPLTTQIGSHSSSLVGHKSMAHSHESKQTGSRPMIPTDLSSFKEPMFLPNPFGSATPMFPFPHLPTLPTFPPLPTFPFIIPTMPTIPSGSNASPEPKNTGSLQRDNRSKGTPWMNERTPILHLHAPFPFHRICCVGN